MNPELGELESPRARGEALLKAQRADVDAALDRWLPPSEGQPGVVHEAMRYSVLAPGKRLRPAIVLLVADTLGLDRDLVMPSAVALELIHAFSLIHDDLPAMDDDDLRRGLPTNHKRFGEATAILAGDALSSLAFEVVARHTPDPKVVPALVIALGEATGTAGMIGGQILDLEGEGLEPTLGRVRAIHERKTAALLAAACAMPAIAGGQSEDTVARLKRFGLLVGTAFQVMDDLLDLHATPEQLGKATNKDAARGKQTWHAAAGEAVARADAERMVKEAIASVRDLDRDGTLEVLARFMVSRGS